MSHGPVGSRGVMSGGRIGHGLKQTAAGVDDAIASSGKIVLFYGFTAARLSFSPLI